MITVLIVLVLSGAVGFFLQRTHKRKQRREALMRSTLSTEDWAVVLKLVPLVERLPEPLKIQLQGKMNLFLDQVEFQGCDGLEVSEDMMLSIAAQACLLVVNSPAWYRNLTTILVYPSAFKSMDVVHDGYVVTERETVRAGESWSRGPVILSWAHSAQGAADDRDGHNVVLHEFAHQLDDLSGRTDGAPVMAEGQEFAAWERDILEAYDRHVQNVERGRKTVLDAYGAQNHEEFFAVAIETFFEKPDQLLEGEPKVYAQISQLLRLDPAQWKA
ncbi:hypothetical protein BXY66_1087 [Shimia isoporae]|uniref:Protein MtfA n=1 Tax=Shimia isoporae TaxID=647720 RepID=A0A4R1NLQ5_9RHOB|nr:M90 family metallopeptidase [Shimia isoporae]TCL09045.1 hypothetical protein BXY66_1087 [Shimia isoporae]